MREPRLGRLQQRVLEDLRSSDFEVSVWDIAMSLFNDDDGPDWPPSERELRSVYEALARLRRRGLVRSRWTWIRDVGRTLVWAPTGSTPLDPGL